MESSGYDLLDPSGSDESLIFVDRGGNNTSPGRPLSIRDDASRCSPRLWHDSQDPYLDAGGGHGYEVAPPASPPGRGMPSAQPKWGTWSVGSDEGRLSSSSAAAADTAAAAATNQDGTAVAAATNQDGTAVAAAAHQAGTGITLMQQMREQLRRSQQSSADEGSVQERGHLRRSQQSSADEGSVEERGQRAGESAPLSTHSSAPLPKLITDRTSEGQGHSDTVPAGAQGELPVAPSGKLESEPRVRQDDHQEASDAHQPLQQRAYSTVASALEAPPTHPCPPASPPSHKPRASRLPQAPPPSQLPSPPPQPHLHRQHSLNAPQPSQPHLHRQHSLNAPQPPQPHLHRQHSINGPQTPQPHLHRQHSLHAPRPVVRTPSPGRAAAGSGTHKTIAAKGGKTRKPSPGRVAQNLALFGQAPRSPPVHPPPPSLQQSQLQVAQQHQPQVEPPLQQPRHTSQQHQPQREPPLLQTAQQQRPQIRAAADESQPAGELSGWRGGGCLDPAAALALATFQRHDPQLQQPSEGSLPLQQYHCEEAALQTAPNSRGASSVDVEPARNSDASTVSNSINDRRTVAYEPDLEGINKMRSVANESYLVGIDSRRTVANGLHSEDIVSTHSVANEPRPEGVQNTQSVANGPHQQGIDNGRSSANEPNLEGVDNGLSIAKEPPLEGTRVHEGPALPFTSLAAANAPALQMAPAAHTATHPAHAHTHSSPRRRLSRSSSSSSSAHASSASRPAAAHPPGLIAAASHALSPGGHLSAESSGSAAASAAMGPRPALSDVATAAAAAAVAANREWLQPHAGPRGVRPGAVPLAVARTRAQRVPPRPRKWDKSVHVQPLPLTQARFVHELQMEEMAFQREQDQYAGGLNKAPPPPKSIKEPPDDQEERLQLMYYREVAARKMQSKRMEQARQEHEQAKLQGCTFVPSISKMSAWITRYNSPAGRACLSQGQSLGSPGRGFTSPRPAAGSPGKSQRSSSVGGGSASTRTTPPRGPQQPPGTEVLDQEQSEAGQSTISLTSTERQERQAVFDRLYRQAAALEQRQQQRLEEERVEQQKRMFRARSPGTERIASNHYMLPKSGPRPDLLPTGMDQCTFRPRTNFARHVRANPRPDPEAEQLRAFDDDDFFTAALGVSMPPSPARLAAFHSPGCPGGGGAVLAQRRQAASMQATGSPIRKKLADPSIRGSTETEGGASSSIVSNAPNALHSISDKLDWDEFLSRQYAFLSQQILRSMEESGAPASPSKPILSAGSAKIMLKKELEGEHYLPPYLRPLSPGRSDVRASAVSKGFSSSSQASYARDRVMGGHKGEEPSYKPLLTEMAARLPPRTAAELMEGGRELRDAKLAELRRQLEAQEKAATPFKPTNFSTKDRYPEVKPRVSRHNPGQHLVVYAQQQLALEEKRMQVQAEREAAEMAECTFHPRTNPLPAYLWKAHQWDVEQLTGPDIDLQLDEGESEAWESLEDDSSFWPGGEAGFAGAEDSATAAAGGVGGGWPGNEYGDPGTSWERGEEMASRHCFRPRGQAGNEGSSIASSSLSSIQMSKPVFDPPGHAYPHLVQRQLQQQQQQQQHTSRASSHSGYSGTGAFDSHVPEMWYPSTARPQQHSHMGSHLGHPGRAYLPLPEEYASEEDVGMGSGGMDLFEQQLHFGGDQLNLGGDSARMATQQQQQQQQFHQQLHHQHQRHRHRQQRPSLRDLPELLGVGEQQPQVFQELQGVGLQPETREQQPHTGVPEDEQTSAASYLPIMSDSFEEPGIMPSPAPLQPLGMHLLSGIYTQPGTHAQPSTHTQHGAHTQSGTRTQHGAHQVQHGRYPYLSQPDSTSVGPWARGQATDPTAAAPNLAGAAPMVGMGVESAQREPRAAQSVRSNGPAVQANTLLGLPLNKPSLGEANKQPHAALLQQPLHVPLSVEANKQPYAALQQQQQQQQQDEPDRPVQASMLQDSLLRGSKEAVPRHQQHDEQGLRHRDSISLSLPPEQDGEALVRGHAPSDPRHHAAAPSGIPPGAQRRAPAPQSGLPPDAQHDAAILSDLSSPDAGGLATGSKSAQLPSPSSDLDLYKQQLAQMQAQLLGS